MMRKKLYSILMLSLTLLLIGIISACVPKGPTPTEPPPKATPTPTPIDLQEVLRHIHQECVPAGIAGRENQHDTPYEYLMYKERQVVVTGRPDVISEVIGGLSELGVELEQRGGFQLGDGTAIRLYQIYQTDGDEKKAWVEQVTCTINALQEFGFAISADPNYHLSPAQWVGGGSPWTQNGKWAEGLDGGGLGTALDTDFLTQWAFGPGGINLLDAKQQRTVDYKGHGVRIGVFDTSPFTGEENELAIPAFAYEVRKLGLSLPDGPTISVTEFKVPFSSLMGRTDLSGAGESLTVWHFGLEPAPNCPGEDRESQDISNHGLFVAGLAHAVAPASEIYLVRVLENDGCGDLYSISEGIEMFMHEMQARNPDGPLVINLSLGVHEPTHPISFTLPITVTSFQRTIQDAMDMDAVVVAAAGNDSYDKVSPDLPNQMEIPAGDDGVIGVAASNMQGGRACFSNEGKVAAPGGDGVEKKDEGSCDIPFDECKANPTSKHCMVSLIYKPDPGYGTWVGTSFATPLVSGLAALTFEKEGTSIGPDVAPAISAQVAGGACQPATSPHYLGAGIINLPHALNGARCP